MDKKNTSSHYPITVTFVLLIIITIGVSLNVNQTQTHQSLTSHAATMTHSNITSVKAIHLTHTKNMPQQTATTTTMTLIVSVKLAGIGQDGNPLPKHQSRRVTAFVYGTGTDVVTTGTAFLTYDGNNYFTGPIHLGKLREGSYFIKPVSDKTLQAFTKPEFQTLLSNKTNIIPPETLYQGDVNGDNVINLTDYNLMLPCFQNATCQATDTIDFNDDGKIDIADYNLLLQSFAVIHGS